MPIYEYHCMACSHKLEVLQKVADAPLQVCPNCNLPKLQKRISAVGFRLKGNGWYETDFKKGDKKNIYDDKTVTSSEKTVAKDAKIIETKPPPKTETNPSDKVVK
ncbi:hypothetical protein TI03_02555 [Achromatium sp. WMS1]|nr:hypothetical protein TI03_02555 [Achromatium sp. WMS1]